MPTPFRSPHRAHRGHPARSSEAGETRVDRSALLIIVVLLPVILFGAAHLVLRWAALFEDPEGPVDQWLPRERETTPSHPQFASIARVSLTRDGDRIVCRIGETTLPSESARELPVGVGVHDRVTGPDLDAIEEHLRGLQNSNTASGARGLPVLLDFSEEVPSRFVVDFVNLCKELEIDDIAFGSGCPPQ